MLSDVGTIIDLSDDESDLVADLFDPDGRRGTPAQHPRGRMVEAMLYLARTGCQWRYLPWAGSPGRSGPTSAATRSPRL
jgi:transposase